MTPTNRPPRGDDVSFEVHSLMNKLGAARLMMLTAKRSDPERVERLTDLDRLDAILAEAIGVVQQIGEIEAQRDISSDARNELLGNLRHDLKTPLLAAYAYAEYLRRRDSLDHIDDELLGQIEAILDASRSVANRSGARAVAHGGDTVGAVIDRVTALFATLHQVDVRSNPEARRVRLERSGFLDVFLDEALTNAWKHGGPTAEISATVQPDHVEVAVVDDGAGFPTDTTDLGQGMRILRDCACALGGTLAFRNEPTAVVLRFPIECPR